MSEQTAEYELSFPWLAAYHGLVAAAGDDEGADGLDGEPPVLALEQQAAQIPEPFALLVPLPKRGHDRSERGGGAGVAGAAEQQAAPIEQRDGLHAGNQRLAQDLGQARRGKERDGGLRHCPSEAATPRAPR